MATNFHWESHDNFYHVWWSAARNACLPTVYYLPSWYYHLMMPPGSWFRHCTSSHPPHPTPSRLLNHTIQPPTFPTDMDCKNDLHTITLATNTSTPTTPPHPSLPLEQLQCILPSALLLHSTWYFHQCTCSIAFNSPYLLSHPLPFPTQSLVNLWINSADSTITQLSPIATPTNDHQHLELISKLQAFMQLFWISSPPPSRDVNGSIGHLLHFWYMHISLCFWYQSLVWLALSWFVLRKPTSLIIQCYCITHQHSLWQVEWALGMVA